MLEPLFPYARMLDTLTGVVVDSDNQTALPFVNIGIRHKNIGASLSNCRNINTTNEK